MESLLKKIHPADLEYVQSSIANSISDKKPFNIFFRYLRQKGEIKYINKKGRIIVDDRNEVTKIFGISQDITELKKTEEQLKIFGLFEKMLSEIYIFRQKDFSFLYANEDALRNIGCTLDELKKHTFSEILKDFETDSFKKITTPLVKNKKDKIVFFGNICREDHSFYPVEIHLQLIKQNESWESFPSFSNNVYLAVVLDLTERKRTEKELASSLQEKELLIKEIHHRVKNNLQVISSLLNLQKSYVKNDHINHIIDESRDRIRSMALLHEKLYQSKNLSLINIKSYIHELAHNLINTYCVSGKNIKLEINSDDENINIDLGISLGLIINEFISNSIKHGFKESQEGIISILFTRSEGNKYYLSVKDNGTGLPEGFDFEKTKTLGLQLVKSLVHQINGKLYINKKSGTEFKVVYNFEDT